MGDAPFLLLIVGFFAAAAAFAALCDRVRASRP